MSDKGLQRELNETAVLCFCKSALAADMYDLMSGIRILQIAKMSQQELDRRMKQHDEWWAEIAEKHEKHLAPLAGPLQNIEQDARSNMCALAWEHVQDTCPKKAKKGGGVGYLLEAWNRLAPAPVSEEKENR